MGKIIVTFMFFESATTHHGVEVGVQKDGEVNIGHLLEAASSLYRVALWQAIDSDLESGMLPSVASSRILEFFNNDKEDQLAKIKERLAQ